MSVPEIEGYTDVVQVARGGFGIVYRARREHLDQDVALKVLALADLSERDRERFQRECRAAGNLSWHPNVVAVHDSGITTDGHPYLAMEYLDSGTLADRLAADGPLPWQEVLDAGIQVAGALGAAHAAGTLHRDLKPENILVGPFGEAKLGDFGIAAVEGSARTATGHAAYTVTHVAPEILRGQRPDECSDLYGLASTLFTLLTGRTPFAGDDPEEPIAAIITRALTEPAPRLAGIPEGLADLLEQTLDKDPVHRPQSAEAFGRALQHIQRDNGQPVTDLRLGRKPAGKPVGGGGGGAGGGATTSNRGDSQRTVTVPPTPSRDAVTGQQPPASGPAAAAETPPPPPQTTPPPPSTPTPGGEQKRANPVLLVGLGVVAFLALAAGAVVVLGGDDEGGGDSPTATPTTTVALETLFVDDLTEDTNDWGELDVEGFSATFTSDGYEIEVQDIPSLFGYPDAGPLVLTDSSTSVDIGNVTQDVRGGVTCRLTRSGPTEYYTLTVNPDSGDFAIARVDLAELDDPVVLAEGTDPDLVGNDVTEVTGTCLGEGDGASVELTLMVNGAVVASATDEDGLGPGISGIAIDAGEGAGSVTFTSYEVAGEEGDLSVELEDDFSDSASGFPDNTVDGDRGAYTDGAYTIQSQDSVIVNVPLRSPVNDSGTASVSVDGDLSGVFAGFCLGGPDGNYEFAISEGGAGSIRLIPGGGNDPVVLEEVSGVFSPGVPVRVSAGWNTDGNSTNIDLFVDGERVVSVSDDAVTSYANLSFCGSVRPDATAGTSVDVTYDDLGVIGDP